eukprot:scaffold4630_cov106-Cylindrotheca_fusiformis.AAC.1
MSPAGFKTCLRWSDARPTREKPTYTTRHSPLSSAPGRRALCPMLPGQYHTCNVSLVLNGGFPIPVREAIITDHGIQSLDDFTDFEDKDIHDLCVSIRR